MSMWSLNGHTFRNFATETKSSRINKRNTSIDIIGHASFHRSLMSLDRDWRWSNFGTCEGETPHSYVVEAPIQRYRYHLEPIPNDTRKNQNLASPNNQILLRQSPEMELKSVPPRLYWKREMWRTRVTTINILMVSLFPVCWVLVSIGWAMHSFCCVIDHKYWQPLPVTTYMYFRGLVQSPCR